MNVASFCGILVYIKNHHLHHNQNHNHDHDDDHDDDDDDDDQLLYHHHDHDRLLRPQNFAVIIHQQHPPYDIIKKKRENEEGKKYSVMRCNNNTYQETELSTYNKGSLEL